MGEVITVDGVTGLVENIGLRCTRLRTADRTRISIPNGKLADLRTESHAARDRYHLNVKLGLVYGTTREQIQQVLTGAEALLREHPQIWPDNVSVRLTALGASALEIEAVAWFEVAGSDAFAMCRQEVLLAMLQVVEEAGTALAFPTQTVLLAPGTSR